MSFAVNLRAGAAGGLALPAAPGSKACAWDPGRRWSRGLRRLAQRLPGP